MTVDLSTAFHAENLTSYKTKSVALRKAREWANLNDNLDNVEIALGAPFRSHVWNGARNVETWLAYDVSATDEGWTITVYRWNSDPLVEQQVWCAEHGRGCEYGCIR